MIILNNISSSDDAADILHSGNFAIIFQIRECIVCSILHSSRCRIYSPRLTSHNSAYIPKSFELNLFRGDSSKKRKEEKNIINNTNSNRDKDKDNEYISSLNNQIYKLENQIEQLQNKVYELNSLNMSFKNDHNKLKNYEILIKNERQKTQMAEKRVIELKKEIEHLLKSNKNNNNIKHRYIHNPKKLLKQNKLRNISMQSSFDKKGKTSESENENLNIFINDLHNQVNKLNNELNENENINDIKINKTNILEETKNNNTSISNNEKNMPEIIENNYGEYRKMMVV